MWTCESSAPVSQMMTASFGHEGMTANDPKECADADKVYAPPDLLVEAFGQAGRVGLRSMRLREGHAGERVFRAGIHQVGKPAP